MSVQDLGASSGFRRPFYMGIRFKPVQCGFTEVRIVSVRVIARYRFHAIAGEFVVGLYLLSTAG